MTHTAGLPPTDRRLVVFADDWGRHPSSCQHLIRPMLGRRPVTWINTIGTRPPKLNGALVRRGIQKLLQWSHSAPPAQSGEAAPDVLNPAMYPGFRSALQRRVNAAVLKRFMERHIPDLSGAVILSTLPIVADLAQHVEARRWVYYCVDDFSAWPGLDSEPLAQMEAEFVKRADLLVAAGETLAARLQGWGRASEVITHGIDLDHWHARPAPSLLVEGIEGPIVLFWGLIDRRLDIGYLRALNDRLTTGTIVLAGPEQDPDPALDSLGRIRRIGPVPYKELPALAAAAAVLVMPYADLPVTRAMQPLKLKEYLANDRPVVCSPLTAVADWADCLDMTASAREFADRVIDRLGSGLPPLQGVARERLAGESWAMKSRRLEQILFSE